MIVGGLLAYTIYIYFFVGFSTILEILAKANYIYLALSIVAMIAAIVCHGISWSVLLEGSMKRWKENVSTVALGLFISYIVPIGAMSEAVRLYIASKILGYGLPRTVLSIMLHRIYVTSVPLLAIAAIEILTGFHAETGHATITAIMLVYTGTIVAPNLLAMGFLGSRLSGKLLAKIEDLLARLEKPLWPGLRGFHREYRQEVSRLARSGLGIVSFTVSLVEWFLLVASMLLIFRALDIERGLVAAVFAILLIQILWWVLPISFSGSIGISDLVASIAYTFLGFTSGEAAAIVILYRLCSITSLALMLYPSANLVGVGPERLRDLARRQGSA